MIPDPGDLRGTQTQIISDPDDHNAIWGLTLESFSSFLEKTRFLIRK